MPIYLGKKATPSQQVSPEAQALGIRMVRQQPSRTPITASPDLVQIGYPAYVANLPAFMLATAKKAVVGLGYEGFPVVLPAGDIMNIRLPALCFSLPNNTVTPAMDQLLSALPHTKTTPPGYKSVLVVLIQYSLQDVHTLLRRVGNSAVMYQHHL